MRNPFFSMIRGLVLVSAIGLSTASYAETQPGVSCDIPSSARGLADSGLRVYHAARDLVAVAGVDTFPGRNPDPCDSTFPVQMIVLPGGWTASGSAHQRCIGSMIRVNAASPRFAHACNNIPQYADSAVKRIRTIVLLV